MNISLTHLLSKFQSGGTNGINDSKFLILLMFNLCGSTGALICSIVAAIPDVLRMSTDLQELVVCGNRNFSLVLAFKKPNEPNFIFETVFYGYRGVV